MGVFIDLQPVSGSLIGASRGVTLPGGPLTPFTVLAAGLVAPGSC